MAYIEPTVSTFKARFPEMDAVPDALVTLVLAEAIPQVGETWLERDRRPAQLYLTAHLLTMEGEPKRSTLGAAGATAGTGQVKRFTVGDVTTELAGPGGGGSGSGSASDYGSTSYGRRYLELMRRNFAGPVAV